MKPPSSRFLGGSAAALLFIPVLYDLCTHDRKRVFSYLASDAYYYLTVAWNFAHFGKLSFDQVRASNGYHPLWQILEALIFTVGRPLPELWLLWGTVLAGAGLIAAALWLVARLFQPLSPFYVLLPVGLFGLLVLPEYFLLRGHDNLPFLGSLWSLVDGMESAATLFAFALALFFYANGKRHVLFGLSAAAVTLARLDHGFFSVFLFLGYLAHLRRDWRAAARVTLAFVGPLALYLAANKLFVGSALPVSGAIKTQFPDISVSNVAKMWALFRSPFAIPSWRFYRLAQIGIPPLATLLADYLLLRKPSRLDEALLLCVPAIWIVAAYDLLYVDLTLHGHWYFPVSIFWMSLIAIRLLDGRPRDAFAGWSVVALSLALSFYSFFTLNERRNYHDDYAGFYLEMAPRIRAHYQNHNLEPRFLEIDDGIFAFSTHFPCISGMGLGLDPAAVRPFQKHQLFPLAFERGYTRLASVMYVFARGIDSRTPSDQLWPWFRGVLSPLDGKHFDFKIEYQEGPFILVEATNK